MIPSNVQNWYDDTHVMETYYKDLEDFLKEHTGCSHVFIAGHFARDVMADADPRGFSGGNTKLGPSQDKLNTGGFSGGSIIRAHNDFTPEYKEQLISYLSPDGELHVENGIQ